MLSALILVRHLAEDPADTLTDRQSRRARSLADFLQLYNPTTLLSGPGRACTGTLAPLAARLDLPVTASPDLAGDPPGLPAAHTAAWFAARALRALPDPRRTAVAALDGHDPAARPRADGVLPGDALLRDALPEHPAPGGTALGHTAPGHAAPPLPGSGWVLHRDDGLLVDLRPLMVR